MKTALLAMHARCARAEAAVAQRRTARLEADHLNFANVPRKIVAEAQVLGQAMGLRCEYEAVGIAEKARLAIKAPCVGVPKSARVFSIRNLVSVFS